MKAEMVCVWGGGVNATPRPLYPREINPLPIVQEAWWAQEPVWKDTDILPPPELSPASSSP